MYALILTYTAINIDFYKEILHFRGLNPMKLLWTYMKEKARKKNTKTDRSVSS